MSLAKNIKYLREAAGHSQKELSQLISVERSTISSYECEKRLPNPVYIRSIAATYGVSVDSLMNDDYEAIGFTPPCFRPKLTGFSEELAETSPYSPTLPTPTEKQLRRKLNDIYRQLTYEDRLLYLHLGLRLLSSYEPKEENDDAEEETQKKEDRS